MMPFGRIPQQLKAPVMTFGSILTAEAPMQDFGGILQHPCAIPMPQVPNFLAFQQQAVQRQLQAQHAAIHHASQQLDMMAAVQNQLSGLSFDGAGVGAVHELQSGPYQPYQGQSHPLGWFYS